MQSSAEAVMRSDLANELLAMTVEVTHLLTAIPLKAS